jgi:hypothetical protein
VTGAPDSLEPARDRARRLHLDHQVDRAHVYAELERAGRRDRGQPPVLESLLDLDALLARERPVVRTHELLTGQLVEALRQTFGKASAVHEDDRAPVRPDQLEDPRVDLRPDRGPLVGCRRRTADLFLERDGIADRGHVLDRDHYLELERLSHASVHDRHRSRRARRSVGSRSAPSTEVTGHNLQRALRRRQPDALRRPLGQRVQPFEGQGKVRAALGAGERMDLVDDHPLDAAERLARRRRQQQVQRLGRGHEDVRWPATEGPPLLGRRVSRPHRHSDLARRFAS